MRLLWKRRRLDRSCCMKLCLGMVGDVISLDGKDAVVSFDSV